MDETYSLEKIEEILNNIIKVLNEKFPDDEFSIERKTNIYSFFPEFRLIKNGTHTDILLPYIFLEDVLYKFLPEDELVAVTLYKLTRTDK